MDFLVLVAFLEVMKMNRRHKPSRHPLSEDPSDFEEEEMTEEQVDEQNEADLSNYEDQMDAESERYCEGD